MIGRKTDANLKRKNNYHNHYLTIPVYCAIMSMALNNQKSGVAKMQNIKESILKTLDTIENSNTVETYKNSLGYFVESLEISQDEAVSSLSLKDFIHFCEVDSRKGLLQTS